MALLTAQELQKLADLYVTIDGLSQSAAQAAATNANNIGNAANELARLQTAYHSLMRDIESTREAFANIVDDINKMNSGTSRAKNAFRGLESLSSKLQSHQSGINTLSSKELETLQKKTDNKIADLVLAKKIADQLTNSFTTAQQTTQEYLDAVAASAEIDSQITKNNSTLSIFNLQLEDSIKIQKQIEKSLGVTGSLMKGMAKIPFLGDLPGMADVMKEVEAEIKAIEKAEGRIVSKQEAMNMAFKKIGSVVKDSLTDPLVLTAITTKLLVSGFKALFEIGMKADTQVTNLSKSMAVSEEHAVATRDRFKEIQDAGGSIYETVTNLVGAQLELASAFGATNGFSEQQLKDQILLTKQMGFVGEEAAGIQQLALANNKTAKDVTNSVIKQTATLAKQTGIQFDNKKIIGEVAKVSGQLSANYKNDPALIAKAVVQANKLGLTLEGAANASSKLLDFESSIQNELEAELLTGKDLNLEKARLLALNGDAAGAAAEMLGQVGSLSEFQNMNVLQQEALAKAVGMTANELANSLRQQENLNSLGDEAKKQIEEKAELLRSNGDIEGANRLMNSIGNEEDAQAALAKIDAQTNFNNLIEKVQSMLGSMAEGPMAEILDTISKWVSNAENMKGLMNTIKGIATIIGSVIGFVINNFKKLASVAIILAAYTAFASAAAIPVIGLGLGIAAAAVVLAAGFGSLYAISDGHIGSDGGLIVSGEKGSYQLDKNDSVIAGTNLMSDGAVKSDGSKGSISFNSESIVVELQNVRSILNQILTKEGSVKMDSTQVGTSTNVGTYKVQ